MTDNHDYETPAKGATDWHVPLNHNFEQIDADVEIRDVEANRGDYEPKAGAKFLATDTERAFVGDGSSWKRLASTGTDPAFDSLDSTGSVLGVPTKVSVQADAGSTGALEGRTGTERGAALYGEHTDASSYGHGVFGTARSDDGVGVFGRVDASQGQGVMGVNRATSGTGVQGVAVDSYGTGVLGQAPSDGYAGLFQGPLKVTGDATLLGEVDVAGPLRPENGFIGVDRSQSIGVGEVFGLRADSDDWGGMYVETTGTNGQPYYGYANDGSPRAYHHYSPADNEWQLVVHGTEVLSVDDAGNLDALGNKNFVQAVDTDDGPKEVVYTATEAGTPHTEATGVAELEDGRAAVDLPDHFAWVTSSEDPLSVQVTAHATEPVRPQVTERSRHRLVIEDVEDPTRSYEVSYTVKGTRAGQEDKEVVRRPEEAAP